MTLARRRPRPSLRSFARLTRPQLEAQAEYLRDEINRQIAARRAQRDALTAWLEQRADAYVADAAHMERAVKPDAAMPKPTFTAAQRRAIADELRQAAVDIERGPDA